LPVMLVFVGFMAGMAMRGVSAQALLSHVPEPARRASFMSLQSAVQHFASGSAATASAWLLVENADKSLGNVPAVGLLTIACMLAMPLMMMRVERRLRSQRNRTASTDSAGAPVAKPAARS